jgi:hypothetical protein
VLRDVFLGLLGVALSARALYVAISPARAIWNGAKSRVPDLPPIRPTARTYFAFLTWMVPIMAAFGFIGVAILLVTLTHNDMFRWLGKVGVGLAWAGLCGVLLHVCVGFFNRPRFLVAPPYRTSKE